MDKLGSQRHKVTFLEKSGKRDDLNQMVFDYQPKFTRLMAMEYANGSQGDEEGVPDRIAPRSVVYFTGRSDRQVHEDMIIEAYGKSYDIVNMAYDATRRYMTITAKSYDQNNRTG